MARPNNTDNFGTARYANPDELAREGILSFQVEAPTKPLGPQANRLAYLNRQPGNYAYILGRLASPVDLLGNVRPVPQEGGGVLAGLASLFGATRGRGKSDNWRGDILGYQGDGHIISFAPTRSGKGIGLVIPNLLHYPGSVICVDPKGENYAITARYRSNVLGQQVIRLDPFRTLDSNNITDAINPLDGLFDPRAKQETYLDAHPELGDDVSNIADAIILRGKDEKDPHWNDKARTLIKGLILGAVFGLGPSRRRHLGEVRRMLTQPVKIFDKMLQDWELNRKTIAGGAVSRAASEILAMSPDELSSVTSTALRHTEFLDSPRALESLGGASSDSGQETYDIRQLKSRGGVSIYIILPPHHMARYSRLIRLWITAAMASMTRTTEGPADLVPVLFMLDEMAQLGRMEPLITAVSLLAGYGMTLWMVWQDLAQIKSIYENEWPSFLANAKVQQFFGINDHETAKMVSEMLGEETVINESKSTTSGTSGEAGIFGSMSGTRQKSESGSVSVAEASRHLLKPDEIRRLNREAMLMFVQGCPPILAQRLAYFQDGEFSGRYDKNPYR